MMNNDRGTEAQPMIRLDDLTPRTDVKGGRGGRVIFGAGSTVRQERNGKQTQNNEPEASSK
jgi:hypothetical protein